MKKHIVFFIGTTAEYIKMFPVIENIKQNNIPYKIIASGQNEISLTDIAKETNLKIDLQLSDEKSIVKNAFGLFSWWLKTLPKGIKLIKSTFVDVDLKRSIMVVHGDTISTTLGAITAKLLGMKSAHVEAGLRSKHLLTPFPEEIDRLVTSKIATYHFAPGLKPFNELPERYNKINTEFNTLVDALEYSKNIPCKDENILNILNDDYCVFVCHRQENLMQHALVRQVVDSAINVSKRKKVVFIMHQITENTLKSLDLYASLEKEPQVVIMGRVEYFDFMKLLSNAQFVITDGGSNQEELSYLGVPTLIIRKFTEREEGLEKNVILSKGNIDMIEQFIQNYNDFKHNESTSEISPSKLISDKLCFELNGGK